mmetsp:Transcript_8078/g.23755  ORF Transcript_8078/g.23755 Transcript_8078/m.23755 type:complete len:97 (+) Transcript_8078:153-443(+)
MPLGLHQQRTLHRVQRVSATSPEADREMPNDGGDMVTVFMPMAHYQSYFWQNIRVIGGKVTGNDVAVSTMKARPSDLYNVPAATMRRHCKPVDSGG